MTNNQWSLSAVQIGESMLPPAALASATYLSGSVAGPMSRGTRRPIGAKPENLPKVPSLFATRLQLELLLQEPAVDLCAITEVILADPGATIELLRLTGKEWEPGEERAERVEDALAGLPLASCQQAIAGHARDACPPAIAAAWEHARAIANRMRHVAEAEDLPHPEQAYLVGLLHELGSLPALLGWVVVAAPASGLDRDLDWKQDGDLGGDLGGDLSGDIDRRTRRQGSAPGESLGALLAEEWRLPSFLVSALQDIEEGSTRSPWARLVASAHCPTVEQGTRVGLQLELAVEAVCLPKHAHSTEASPIRSRVLSFMSSERAAWKHGATTRHRVASPMRPPA